ncbi:adenylyl-sulfate kinase [Nonlabens xiamenensis]|uniref:adenylyl-sulfate kinase n=1 Tax=Nonlabens xiamenensis TaxID=2341043 RepID=UPI000F610B75|nr:adenylyl-sulfate kinase [Nonlabens xiamenensis]
MSAEHIYKHDFSDIIAKRKALKGHQPLLIWFTGLSGSGKSTLARHLELFLNDQGVHTFVLDGDNLRTGLNAGLSFSAADRTENLRRVAEVAKLFLDAGTVAISAFVSPLQEQRSMIKTIVGAENVFEIFVSTSLEICENRDVNGLYKKARSGEVKNFTGISAPYEKPSDPDLIIDTEKMDIPEAIEEIATAIMKKIQP